MKPGPEISCSHLDQSVSVLVPVPLDKGTEDSGNEIGRYNNAGSRKRQQQQQQNNLPKLPEGLESPLFAISPSFIKGKAVTIKSLSSNREKGVYVCQSKLMSHKPTSLTMFRQSRPFLFKFGEILAALKDAAISNARKLSGMS